MLALNDNKNIKYFKNTKNIIKLNDFNINNIDTYDNNINNNNNNNNNNTKNIINIIKIISNNNCKSIDNEVINLTDNWAYSAIINIDKNLNLFLINIILNIIECYIINYLNKCIDAKSIFSFTTKKIILNSKLDLKFNIPIDTEYIYIIVIYIPKTYDYFFILQLLHILNNICNNNIINVANLSNNFNIISSIKFNNFILLENFYI